MAAFWDKIKSIGKDDDEKKDKEQKEDASKVEDEKKDEKKEEISKAEIKEEKTEEKPKEENKKAEKKDKKEQPAKKSLAKKAVKKIKRKDLTPQEAQLINKVLVQPKISEAAMNQQALGKYVFMVSNEATKPEVARSIEAMYGVTVEGVNTIRYKPKNHGFKGMSGTKKGYKKAVVSLKKGDSIELFKESK